MYTKCDKNPASQRSVSPDDDGLDNVTETENPPHGSKFSLIPSIRTLSTNIFALLVIL